jgi:hypothetical protein
MRAFDIKEITAICVVCKTKELFEICYNSFRKLYPYTNLIVINGMAGDDCTTYLDSIASSDVNLKLFKFKNNIGHGPGMHAALCFANTLYKYAYIFDSDTRQDIPILEEFYKIKTEDFYGIGSVGKVNEKGFGAKDDSYIPYVHPAILFLHIESYFKYAPFHDHGAPILNAMKDLYDKKQSDKLINFPVRKYVFHNWRGTRNVTRKYL